MQTPAHKTKRSNPRFKGQVTAAAVAAAAAAAAGRERVALSPPHTEPSELR